jgi:VanZ family protein
VAVILIVIAIFTFSSQPNKQSNDNSRSVVDFIIVFSGFENVLKNIPVLYNNRNIIFRKIIHFTEYGVLSIFLYQAYCYLRVKKTLFFVLMTILVLAGLDELYQSTVPYRNSQLRDVMIDFSGAVFAMFVFLRIKKLRGQVRA